MNCSEVSHKDVGFVTLRSYGNSIHILFHNSFLSRFFFYSLNVFSLSLASSQFFLLIKCMYSLSFTGLFLNNTELNFFFNFVF